MESWTFDSFVTYIAADEKMDDVWPCMTTRTSALGGRTLNFWRPNKLHCFGIVPITIRLYFNDKWLLEHTNYIISVKLFWIMIYVIYSFLSTFNQSHSVDTYYIYHYWLWCARVCLDRSPPAEISISPFSRQRQRRASYKSASFLLNDPFYQKSAQPILHLSYSLVWVYFRSCSVSWRWLERYESNFWTVSCSPTAQIVGITGFPPWFNHPFNWDSNFETNEMINKNHYLCNILQSHWWLAGPECSETTVAFVLFVLYDMSRERGRESSRVVASREVTKIPSIPIGIVFILRTSTYMTDVNYLYSTIFSVKGITSFISSEYNMAQFWLAGI
jgi:hypothetical protein